MTEGASLRPGAPHGAADVIAHRGASAYAPENTLAAFALAAEMGAHWFELDCTLTKDGEVVVIHDDALDRTTDLAGPVCDLTLDRLRQCDAGSWYGPAFRNEPLPTLSDALEFARGRIGVYIEIKDSADDSELELRVARLAEEGPATAAPLLPDLCGGVMDLVEASGTRNLELTRKVIAAVRRQNMERQVVLESFSPIVCAVALIEAPGLRTELLASSSKKHPDRWDNCLAWETFLDPPGFNVAAKDLTEGLLRQFHAAGKTVAVWTVNGEDEMKRFIDMGVDAIVTNHPDICLGLLGG